MLKRMVCHSIPHANSIFLNDMGDSVHKPIPDRLKILTAREIEVLTLLSQGLSVPVIAQRLYRSRKTIQTHRLALGRKLRVHNRVELARIAIECGLVSLRQHLPSVIPERPPAGVFERVFDAAPVPILLFRHHADDFILVAGNRRAGALGLVSGASPTGPSLTHRHPSAGNLVSALRRCLREQVEVPHIDITDLQQAATPPSAPLLASCHYVDTDHVALVCADAGAARHRASPDVTAPASPRMPPCSPAAATPPDDR